MWRGARPLPTSFPSSLRGRNSTALITRSQSLSVAARTNRRPIEQGRVFLREADVSDLPYDDGRFDLGRGASTPTIFGRIWQQTFARLSAFCSPVGRSLSPEENILEANTTQRNRRLASNGRMNCQTLPELRDTLSEAGYSNTEIHEEWKRGMVLRGRPQASGRHGGKSIGNRAAGRRLTKHCAEPEPQRSV